MTTYRSVAAAGTGTTANQVDLVVTLLEHVIRCQSLFHILIIRGIIIALCTLPNLGTLPMGINMCLVESYCVYYLNTIFKI